MSVKIAQLPRFFKIGATLVEDPAPSLSLQESFEILTRTSYSMLRHTRVFEADAKPEKDKIVYEIHLSPAKSNG